MHDKIEATLLLRTADAVLGAGTLMVVLLILFVALPMLVIWPKLLFGTQVLRKLSSRDKGEISSRIQ